MKDRPSLLMSLGKTLPIQVRARLTVAASSYLPQRGSTPLSSSSNHVAGLVYAGTTNYWIFSVITNVSVPTGVTELMIVPVKFEAVEASKL